MAILEEISSMREDVAELKNLLERAQRDKVKYILSIELRKLETKLADLVETEAKQKDGTAAASATAKNASSGQRSYDVEIKNYSWDQSDAFIKIYLTGLDGVNEVEKEKFSFEPQSQSVFFKVSDFKNRNMIFSIKALSEKIVVEKSHFKAKSDMVVLFLKKETSGGKWTHLKKVDKEAAEKTKVTPPSNDDNADPSASLMSMMKQMYQDGDDEMKRTIAKAWTESQSKGGGGMPGMGGMGGMPGMGGMGGMPGLGGMDL